MALDTLMSKFVEPLIELVTKEVDKLFGVPGEIQKLQKKLHKISQVLADAERKRNNDEAIDNWLKELKDVMYDIDDILDLCRIEANKGSEGSSSTSLVRFLFPFHSGIRKAYDIGTKINELSQKLEEIWRWRSEFNLELTSHDKQQVTSKISRKTSPVGEIDIVGSEIEEHTQSLVDLLIKDDRRRNILIFTIVGVGGIGKTTLAKRIYNDQRIQEEFSVKRWICVSQEFDEIKLLQDFLDGNKNDRATDQSKSLLEPKVESSFGGKKLFLVLDDVWTAKVWCDLLCNTLKGCASGSRILVTTRNGQIAKQMLAVHIHHVHKLSLEDGWSLLCKKVVLTGEEGEIQHLKDIGMKIVEKCDGLPLAIKAIAGMLCTKEKSRSDWNGVLESTAWYASWLPEEVKGALYLSYEDLPSYLKQCFTYLSVYSEDYPIYMEEISQLWIAEGFVKAEGSSMIEKTAEGYFRELIMRNLLQPHFDHEGAHQMHDLIHCLARYLARDESLVVTKGHEIGSSNWPMKLRHVLVEDFGITDNVKTEILELIGKQDSLRTLVYVGSLMSATWMDVAFNKLVRLRVLFICFSKIQSLPDSLGNLIHLRYLDIRETKISTMPETIGNLRNLQFLKIWGTPSLSRLPNSIVNLTNLRSLDFCDAGLVEMPTGLGRLQNLHTLTEFRLPSNRAEGWSTIEELRSLSCLTFLSIERLECISSSSEARAAELRNKHKLTTLWLGCTQCPEPSKEEMRRIEEVFEELQPPPCLEGLQITGYFGREFPTWMAKTSSSTSILFPNLHWLHLIGCNHCERLQPCGLLPSLEDLSIKDGAASIIDVGPEFSVGTGGSSSGGGRAVADISKYAFPSLETLVFKNMPNWQEWHWDKGTQAMPRLKHLTLEGCPNLTSLPEGLLLHATSLKTLTISGAGSLTTIENLLSLKELDISDAPKLEKVSDLPALTTLEVWSCPKLQVVENLQSLRWLKLVDDDMKSLPLYLLKGVQRGTKKRKIIQTAHLGKLEKLEIQCSMELIRKISRRASPEWPTIKGIQKVLVFLPYRSMHVFYNKSPYSFTANFDDTTTSSHSEMPKSSSDPCLLCQVVEPKGRGALMHRKSQHEKWNLPIYGTYQTEPKWRSYMYTRKSKQEQGL